MNRGLLLNSSNCVEKGKVLSLFSGAGGLDLGLEQTGRFKVILANEILINPAITYTNNFQVALLSLEPHLEELPGISYGDVELLKFKALGDLDIDLVTGGPPCQDFSIS